MILTPPPPKPRNLLQKIATIAGIAAGIGFGTCSLGAFTPLSERHVGPHLTSIGVGLFFLSIAVLLLTLIAFLIQQLWETLRK